MRKDTWAPRSLVALPEMQRGAASNSEEQGVTREERSKGRKERLEIKVERAAELSKASEENGKVEDSSQNTEQKRRDERTRCDQDVGHVG